MSEITQDIHKKFSAQCFNACWDHIDNPERSDAETEQMILLASTSLWHWTQREDCTPTSLSVGYWQMARVHTVAGQFEAAEIWATRCRDISESNDVDPVYRGFAYEALARLEASRGNSDAARKHLETANDFLDQVEGDQDRALLKADLATINPDNAG